jgi:hypothetical protein
MWAARRLMFDNRAVMRKILRVFVVLAIAALCSAAEPDIPPQLRGKWLVKRELPTSTISCWGEEEVKTLIGTEIEYGADSFRWRDKLTSRPTVKVSRVSAKRFQLENSGQGANSSQVSFRELGVGAPYLTQVELEHPPAAITEATGEIPGDRVFLKDANMIVFSVCNVYFEARRVSTKSRSLR